MNAQTCPHHKATLRADLPPMIPRIAKLPVDERGYPVPWFVSWIDGKPEFRIADSDKLIAALRLKLCWVCGEPLGTYKAFVIGPMCVVNRTTSEPPSHHDCATWSVQGCPFLVKPQMVRRGSDDAIIQERKDNVAGMMIERNPGVCALWVTPSYEVFADPRGRPLITIGEPREVTWWRGGRVATLAEVMGAVESGLPFLRRACEQEPTPKDREEAFAELDRRVTSAAKWWPK